MGNFSDKIAKAFKFKDGEDYDDEYYDDEYDDGYDDDFEDEYDDDRNGFFKKKERPVEEKQSLFSRAASRPLTRTTRSGQQEVCIFKPSTIEDSREITETLLDGKAVVVNFEGLHVEISQRIIDFISGSCYALNGNLQKISTYIFIATPENVDISGDFQELLASDDSYDMTGFQSPLI